MLEIKEVALKYMPGMGNSVHLIITVNHIPGIKIGDYFVVESPEKTYFPLRVMAITETEDILIPSGHFRWMKFKPVENYSLEELQVINTFKYRLATLEEKEKLKNESCWL